MDGNWQADLERWLAPFVAALRHKTRTRMCPAYVAGLIGPGDRKSVQPMAARAGTVSYDQLHHFVASGVWDAAPLEAALLGEADRQVGGNDAWLIVDDTALPKKGRHSVGVAPGQVVVRAAMKRRLVQAALERGSDSHLMILSGGVVLFEGESAPWRGAYDCRP